MFIRCAALMLLLTVADQTVAQESATVTTGASAMEILRPNHASFDLTVRSNAREVNAARAENAAMTAAVRSALLTAGLPLADLKSTQLTVAAHWTAARDAEPKQSGYDAINRLHIDTQQLETVGLYLDTALQAGAREISEVSFRADDVADARRRALAKAVALAEGDARAIATAAHQSLGRLIALSTQKLPGDGGDSGDVAVRPLMAPAARAYRTDADQSVSTSVVIPDITVSATVNGRWRLGSETP
jgi:uncharacterized protein YggE